jgi:hypothetical protein
MPSTVPAIKTSNLTDFLSILFGAVGKADDATQGAKRIQDDSLPIIISLRHN